ncbi:unnamed protein product [Didymodactylos carnosus]|uniref:Fork-head domain-containing protein n=1 Tax=Didymodactylos carnosus TaxID=1234261 RepID=A0A814MBG6_9BILA|nr:unnamed protein product [Didymodactylos carnosus]CAF3842283.1 unnamed protein product [Didymodactylos carnosus]
MEVPRAWMGSERSSKIEETLVAPNSSPVSLSGNVLPVATATRTTKAPVRKKGRNKLVDELGFRNPGPKNVVTNVSSRRMKNIRRNSTQERTGRSRPVYDNVGLLISDKSDRCDCNRKACPGLKNFVYARSKMFAQTYKTYDGKIPQRLTNMNSRQTLSSKSANTIRQNHQQSTPLDCSLTSIEWLPNMKIGKPITSATPPPPPPPLSMMTTANMDEISTSTLNRHNTVPISYNNQELTNYCDDYPISEPTFMSNPTLTMQQHLSNGFIQHQPCEQYQKPPCSYVSLIRRAILSTPNQRMTLNEIYHWIIEKYPYFKKAPPKWKNSIRHNLSLNKCFKKVQRGTNDPGKGSYWTIEESETNSTIRKRHPEDQIHSQQQVCSGQPQASNTSTAYYNNPMIYDINSVGGQSSSTDDSDSPAGLTSNCQWMPEDINIELTASFRRFREQVLDSNNSFSTDLFPHGDSFIESVKMAGSGEINWNDIKLEPYCELLDTVRASSTFQDRDQLINLASSLSNFFDYTGITNMVQSRTNDSRSLNCVMNESNDLNFCHFIMVYEYRIFYKVDDVHQWESLKSGIEIRTDIYYLLSGDHQNDCGLKLRRESSLELKYRVEKRADNQELWSKIVIKTVVGADNDNQLSFETFEDVVKQLKKYMEKNNDKNNIIKSIINSLESNNDIILCYVKKFRKQKLHLRYMEEHTGLIVKYYRLSQQDKYIQSISPELYYESICVENSRPLDTSAMNKVNQCNDEQQKCYIQGYPEFLYGQYQLLKNESS